MLKVFAGGRQTGRTTLLIDQTVKYLKDTRKVSLLFHGDIEAHNFCRMLLITLLDKPIEHTVETKHVVNLLEALGYQVNIYLLYSLREVMKNSSRDELIVHDGWRCLGDAEFQQIENMSRSRRVLAAIDPATHRSLSLAYRGHSSITVLDIEGMSDDSSNGNVPTVDFPHAH